MFTSAITCFIVKFFCFPLHSACHLGEVQQRRLGIIIIQDHYSGDVVISHYHIGSQQALVGQNKKQKKMTGMSMIALRNQTVAREFFPSFDSANGCLCQERLLSSRYFATMVTCSGRSRPSDKRGRQSSRPWDKGAGGGASLQKNFCESFGPGQALTLDPPLTWCHTSPPYGLWTEEGWALHATLIKLTMTKVSATLIYLCTYRL